MTVNVTPYFRRNVQLDAVVVEGIRAMGNHGVLAAEKEADQLFLADVVVHVDTRSAARTDDLAKSVNYATVADIAARILADDPAELIEAVADRIALDVLKLDNVAAVDVTVHKPQAPLTVEFADVSITIRRDIVQGDLWSDLRIGSAAGLADDPRSPGAVGEPKDELDSRPQQPVPVLLAIGGNVGDSEYTLARAIYDLDRVPGIEIVRNSPLVVTKPVGGPEQPDFFNAVVRINTALSPRALLHVCQGIEMVHGRQRQVQNGPRTLDIDIIDYTGVTSEREDLILPHPRAYERAFVLLPWVAMEPAAELVAGTHSRGGKVEDLAQAAADIDGVTIAANPWDPAEAVRRGYRSSGPATSSFPIVDAPPPTEGADPSNPPPPMAIPEALE